MLVTPYLSGSNTIVPTLDKSVIKWSGFYSTSEQALADFNKQLATISKNNSIVWTDSRYVHRHFKGYFLYNFTVSAIPLSAI